MQKNQLRVNRLIRVKYGPYTVGSLLHGEVKEAELTKDVVKIQYLQRRKNLHALEEAKRERLGENDQIVIIGNHARKLVGIEDKADEEFKKVEEKPKSLLQRVRKLN